ncbi:Fur family transcriptional regulator [Nocardioides campestrisoli]|uniref:Fur family transcriptional regulator n=1 Tax=Nocardioides campestrisoli TaxID=2736757 RepID=UPI00163D6E6C|nr:Fur family transcriptional regulator [Nocardioides campestrisoli]
MTDELAEALRSSGYRLTPQRRLVLAAVTELGHATPEEVRDHVGDGANLSTVYRALEVLEQLGLVRHAHLVDRAPTYHSTSEPAHFHLVCRNCQKVTSVDPDRAEPLLSRLRAEHGFVTDVGHLAIFGRCEDCDDTRDPEHEHQHDQHEHDQHEHEQHERDQPSA